MLANEIDCASPPLTRGRAKKPRLEERPANATQENNPLTAQGALAALQEKEDQDALAALAGRARAAREDGYESDESDDEEFAERRRYQCDAKEKSRLQTWVGALNKSVPFCLGTRDGADLDTLNRRFNLRDDPKLLAEGKFADVLQAMDGKRQQKVAIKLIGFKQKMTAGLENQLKREVELMTTVEHENILPFHGIVPLAFCARLAIVTDVYWRDLYSVIGKAPGRCLSTRAAAGCFKQVAAALAYLHGRHIAFRDVKAEHVALETDGTAKLVDFGWARSLAKGERATTLCGTLDYLPPEMIRGDSHDHRVDLWSLGVLGYEMLVGKPPFEADGHLETYDLITSLRYQWPKWVKTGAPEAITLIDTCLLKLKPADRTEARDLSSHPWLNMQAPAAAAAPAAATNTTAAKKKKQAAAPSSKAPSPLQTLLLALAQRGVAEAP